MGAISAVISKKGAVQQPGTVDRMLAAAPHRGSVATVLGQGHALLGVAVHDDRADAWLSQRDGLAAAFVGVLDNAEALLKRFPPQPHELTAINPADLLLAAFRALGDETPKYLRGAFAAVVTDGKRLVAFRDHVGFSPLFYWNDEHLFVIASEPKQIVAGAGISYQPDPEVVERIFYKRVEDETPCALKGVRRLPKASLISVRAGESAAIRRYWDPEKLLETAPFSPDDLPDRFDELMTQAVTRVLTGEDIIAISGGIDSNAVAAFAAPAHLDRMGRPLPALTQVFPDLPRVDERRYVEEVANYLGLALHTFTSNVGHFDRLAHWVRLADGPPLAMLEDFADEHRVVRGLGLRTILTGEFGEFVYDMRYHVVTHLVATKRFAAIWKRLSAPPPSRAPWKSSLREMITASLPPLLLLAYRRLADRRPDPRIPEWLAIPRKYGGYSRSDPQIHPHLRWRARQMAAFQGPGIGLESAEICATANGVTVRRPLCDVDLWEFFLSLPAELKFPDTRSKTLVRRLLRGKLPDSILDRSQKTVFDDYVLSRIDYPVLQRWLLDVPYRMIGVDYQRLRDRLERHAFTVTDYLWARELAAIHAFMSLW